MATAVDETSNFKVDKLTSNNYHHWKFNVKMYLIGKDLWEIVSGEEVLAEEASEETKRKFKKRENAALASICLSISTNLQIYVRSAKNPKEAWDTLANHFEEKTLSKKIFYRRKLYSARMGNNTDMISHVNYLKTISEHLEAVGDPVVEKDLVMILISSLPEDYNNLITTLETLDEAKLTWVYVRDRVVHEYDRKKGGNKYKEDKDNPALFMYNKHKKSGGYKNSGGNRSASSKNSGGNSVEVKPKTYTCHFCHEKGHFKRDCLKWKASKGEHKGNIACRDVDDYVPEFALKIDNNLNENIWWIDSGASQHMTPNKKDFFVYTEFQKPINIKLADNSTLYSYGTGDVRVTIHDNGNKFNIELRNVLYVPKIKNKLLSLPVIIENGADVLFRGDICQLTVNNKKYNIGHRCGKLFKLNSELETCCLAKNNEVESFELWHLRYGHLNHHDVKLLSDKNMVHGMNLNSYEIEKGCQGCAMGKQKRLPFPGKTGTKTTKPLELIHSDVCGPMSVPSVGGSRYFVSFIDDYSRYTTVHMMKNKSEVSDKLLKFVNLAENLTGEKVKKVRSDNGGEYVGNDIIEFCKHRGIVHEYTIPYTPQQNGVAERMNRTLMEMARSMLYHANLEKELWAEAVSTAAYLRNRSPTSSFKGETPYSRWYKVKPDVGHLRVFGSDVYVHIPDEKRQKLDSKSMAGIFVGYPETSKGYKIYDPVKRVMMRSRDVIFLENKYTFNNQKVGKESWYFDGLDGMSELDVNVERNEEADIQQLDNNIQVEEENQVHNERPVRARQPPNRFGEWDFASVASSVQEPRSIKQALKGEQAKEWKEAADQEYRSLIDSGTWDLVDLPANKNLVGCKWVFKVKCNANGNIDRYKARLVAQGYSQRHGVDYDEVFAPVARYTTIRTLLAIANQYNLEIHQMDVKSAFLHGSLDNEIFMKQPEGYVDKNYPDKVCKLKRSLYGLKQSARCWNSCIDDFLKSCGYSQSKADPCVYYKSEMRDGKQSLIITAVYVDDIILLSDDIEFLMQEKQKLCNNFQMDDRGELNYLLGMVITRDRTKRVLTIDQNLYLRNVLQRFGMEDCKPVATPLDSGAKFSVLAEGEKSVDITEYQSAIGSLTYASIATRPDLAAAVGILSRFMSNPSQEHWSGVKRIFRYIKGTLNHRLKYVGVDEEDFKLSGYSDADWGGDVDSRKSTSGYIYKLGNSTISWKSKRQPVVALSSTEAEYVALCLAAQEAVWLRFLLNDVKIKQNNPTIIFEDNQGAICLSKNPGDHPRTKHIDVKFHYIRQTIENKHIDITYCETNKMIADIFTKGLPKQKFEFFRNMMGVAEH